MERVRNFVKNYKKKKKKSATLVKIMKSCQKNPDKFSNISEHYEEQLKTDKFSHVQNSSVKYCKHLESIMIFNIEKIHIEYTQIQTPVNLSTVSDVKK